MNKKYWMEDKIVKFYCRIKEKIFSMETKCIHSDLSK
jgi:hypothetical protein